MQGPEVCTLKGCQAVDVDPLVLGHDDHLSIVLSELEAANH